MLLCEPPGEVVKAWDTEAALEGAGIKSRNDWQEVSTPGLGFDWAIIALKAGKRVTRTGWNGKGMWLELQVPDAHSKMSLPYIYMKTACNNRVPWLASQTDVLSDDWMIAS